MSYCLEFTVLVTVGPEASTDVSLLCIESVTVWHTCECFVDQKSKPTNYIYPIQKANFEDFFANDYWASVFEISSVLNSFTWNIKYDLFALFSQQIKTKFLKRSQKWDSTCTHLVPLDGTRESTEFSLVKLSHSLPRSGMW